MKKPWRAFFSPGQWFGHPCPRLSALFRGPQLLFGKCLDLSIGCSHQASVEETVGSSSF